MQRCDPSPRPLARFASPFGLLFPVVFIRGLRLCRPVGPLFPAPPPQAVLFLLLRPGSVVGSYLRPPFFLFPFLLSRYPYVPLPALLRLYI